MPSLNNTKNTYTGTYDDIRFMLSGKVEGTMQGQFALQLITENATSWVTL